MATADWAGMCPCRSAGSWAAIGPGVCEFEGVGGLWQEVFPPGCGDDRDAGGRAGGVVVVGGDGDGWLAGEVEQGGGYGHGVAVGRCHRGVGAGAWLPGADGWRQACHGGGEEEVEAGEEALGGAPRQLLGDRKSVV